MAERRRPNITEQLQQLNLDIFSQNPDTLTQTQKDEYWLKYNNLSLEIEQILDTMPDNLTKTLTALNAALIQYITKPNFPYPSNPQQ